MVRQASEGELAVKLDEPISVERYALAWVGSAFSVFYGAKLSVYLECVLNYLIIPGPP